MISRLRRYVTRHHWGMFATFVALTGTAYATGALPANSVGTKQIRNNAVTLSKVAPTARASLRAGARGKAGGDLTGSYPNPSIKSGAVTPSKLAPPPAQTTAVLSARLFTGIGPAWHDDDAPNFGVARYYRDDQDVVHLNGVVMSVDSTPTSSNTQNQCANGSPAPTLPTILVLPAGYRPAAREIFSVDSDNAHGRVDVTPDGQVICMYGRGDKYVSLDGISFRASGR